MTDDDDSPLDSIDLEKLAVEQALIDAEIANERARELTLRLIESTRTIAELREALLQTEERIAQLEEAERATRSTQAYRLAERIWNVVRAIRG